MPEPEYWDGEYDPDELPDPRMEIMGRGAANRKSKTLLPSIELAVTLGLVKEHLQTLLELFRDMHSRHYEIEQITEHPDGSVTKALVPEVLTDAQIFERYPSTRMWRTFHQEQVDHYPSVGGFSTKAAMGYEDEPKRREQKESSAGTDRGSRSRWE